MCNYHFLLKASHAGDHSYGNKKHRNLIQVTKKKDCHEAIKIKVVIKFPQYKVCLTYKDNFPINSFW